jgi:glutamate dehydrogenase
MSTVTGASFAFPLKDFERRAIEMAGDVFAPGGAPDAAALRFLEQLHEDAVAEDLEELVVDDMVFLAADFWTWAQQRPASGAMIRCHPGVHADGRPMRRDILEIVTGDKPFLVDSVMAEINGQGADVLAMFHPIVTLERDAAGARAASRSGASASAPRAESMMQVHIEPLDEAARAKLERGLEESLADVEAAVADYADMRARMDQVIDEIKAAPIRVSGEELEESIAFLRWLRDDNFAFLGCRVYEFPTDAQGAFIRDEPVILEETGRGVLRDPDRHVLRRGSEPAIITPAIEEFLREPSPLIVAKSNLISRVHRRVHMDYVGIKRYRADGEVSGETRFVGLFTATAYHAPVSDVPLVRRKVRRVLERAEKSPESHSHKQLQSILETYPRDELFQSDENELYEISRGILHLFDRPRPKLFIRRDRFDRFLAALVFIPRERFNSKLREQVGLLIAERYGGRVSAFYPYFGEGPLARVHFIIGLTPFDHPEPDPQDLERRIAELARTWEDEFLRVAREEAPSTLRPRLGAYEQAFSAGYRETFSPREALDDVEAVEAIDPLTGVNVRAAQREGDGADLLRFKVYRQGEAIPLSDVMPILENMGLHVEGETSYPIRCARRPGDSAAEPPVVWLHDFRMRRRDGAIELESVRRAFEDGFTATWTGRNESDGFNRLILDAGASWRDVCFLRACAKYRQQTGLDPSQQVQEEALSDNPEIARLLIELKTVRFDPGFARDTDARAARQAEIDDTIGRALDKVESLDADRVLRRLWRLIRATQRTNFYQTDPDGAPKPAIALKIASREIEELQEPKPFREIFVWSPRVEGVHIRFGAVARGGLRWSDRRDDFRTEVLGLVKAQFVKNAVIVPVGAKGGFYPKQLPKMSAGGGDREAFLAEGVAAYRLFVSSLLDVTDNIVDDAVLHPHRVVVWDGEDPYLVVAADKGTASFSDIANEISEQRGFWLADAFASGGSAGYDHKKMAITARGGWEAVKRHFRELGLNIQEEPFTIIGVGDMSGDVFGNGMLLSKQIRLIAAFDHRDIFIDPNPADPERSWTERQRMFELSRSSWKDYDGSLISQGGGVFARAAKSIPLSPEIKALTGIDKDTATPADLIRALLAAPCDLLWFGGIGCYIKSVQETDLQVGDKTNDGVRVNAEEVRARVIGEGANLGVTQAGRVALGRRGVKLNADFIDNSAGVDSSDHEVNIKILLNPVVRAGRMSREERDALLARMTDDVARKVLKHNYDQTLAISIAESTAAADLDSYERLIERFEARGVLNRRIEGLPTSDQFRELKKQGLGLTRPEIATLIAYAKLSLYQRILDSSVPDDPHFDALLEEYFPPALAGFAEDMRKHRLRREIIATVISNEVVNFGGATFSHRARESTGADTDAVARGFEAARQIFGFGELLGRIHALDNAAPAELQLELYREIIALLRRQTHWFVRWGRGAEKESLTPLQPVIDAYRPGVERLRAAALESISPFERESVEEHVNELIGEGAPVDLARDVARLRPLTSASDVIDLAIRTRCDPEDASRLYHAIGDRFRFDRLRAAAVALRSSEHWDRLAARRLIEDLYADQQQIAEVVFSCRQAAEGDADWTSAAIEEWARRNAEEVVRAEETLGEIEPGGWSLAKLTLAAAALRELVSSAKA